MLEKAMGHHQARGISFAPSNFVVTRKMYFKHKIKTKNLSPLKKEFFPQNLETWPRA